MTPAVVVYGTVALDRFVRVDGDGVPQTNDPPQELPGGEAFNTAHALAHWGVRVVLTGTAIGGDPEGERLRALLDDPERGMPRSHVPDRPDAVTPVCTISVFPDGERRMRGRGFDRAQPPPLPTDLLASRPLVAWDPNLGAAALEMAHAAVAQGGSLIAMDAAHLPQIVGCSHIVLVSREALERFGGPSGTPVQIVERLRADGARTAILTLGRDGGIASDRDEGLLTWQAYESGPAIDTTGAGDIFRAGLCYGLLHAWPLARTLRFAAVAAGEHCRRWGGSSKINLSQILRLCQNGQGSTV
jgi:sugar/nucleoside kinase (ribokinase family)